jgi:leucyl aminopeptidase
MTEIKITPEYDIENQTLIFFGNSKTSDKSFENIYQPIFDVGDFQGKLHEIFVAYNYNKESPTKRIFLVGLGDKENLSIEDTRRIFGALGSKLRNKNIEHIGIDLSPLDDISKSYHEAALEGLLLGNYRYQAQLTKEQNIKKPLQLIAIKSNSKIEETITHAKIVAEGTNLTRELGNLPSNIATPTYLAEQAKKLVDSGIKVTILEKEDIIKENMGLFEAVFRGSADIDPPKFIIMDYEPENYDRTLVLVGKAITFDTGGVSLKPVAGMGDMISDMCGGGAVIGAMKVISEMNAKPGFRVIGLVPSTPNVVDGKSYRPGDVITSRAGKTIEVTSTDAEGRMLLADTLDYAKKYKPDLVFDFATLTGSIHRALGPYNAGYFVNEKAKTLDGLVQLIFDVGQKSGDRVWQMPMDKDYFQHLKSKFADLKQSGGPLGGAITAALLLNEFTDYPWVHFDIAGTAFLKSLPKPESYNAQIGATGFGVRFISQFIREWK